MNDQSMQDVASTLDRVGAALRVQEDFIERCARVLPAQRTIRFGDTWVRFLADERGCAWSARTAHVHWGRVLTVREYAVGRVEAGDSPEEIEAHIATLRGRQERGWRLSLVHCDSTTQSELASVPLASVWPCNPGQYAAAQAVGFDGARIHGLRWFDLLLRQYRAEVSMQATQAGFVSEYPLFVPVKEEDHG